MVKGKGVWLGLLLLLLLWPATSVFADEPVLNFDGGQIFVDEDVSLEPGETVNGDLGVFDGDLTVPQGSTINGDVFVTNGNADIAGQVHGDVGVINGDLTLSQTGQVQGEVFGMSGRLEIAGHVGGNLAVMFGDIKLQSTASVQGDLVVLSGSLEREAGAQVFGDELPEIPLPEIPIIPPKPERPALPPLPPQPPVPPQFHGPTPGQQFGRFVGRTFAAGFLSLLFIAVGVLIVFIWPRQTHKVADCIAALPVQSFGLGLLTFLIAAVLEAFAVVLMILIILVAAVLIGTVILIPIGLLLILLSVLLLLPVPLLLAGAVVLGWVGLADGIGQKILKVLNVTNVTPVSAVVVGLLATVPLAAFLWIIKPACCAWPFIILLTSAGLGAVIHTRFGRQSCRQPGTPGPGEVLPMEAMTEETGQPDGPPSHST